MKTRKLCINECIPYVQKYEWGKGKDGMVYDVMKNIVKENFELVKKEIDKAEHIKEYAPNGEGEKRKKEGAASASAASASAASAAGEVAKGVETAPAAEKSKQSEPNSGSGEQPSGSGEQPSGSGDQPSGSGEEANANDAPEPKYAELWIGNHEKGPNLVLYKNSFIKIEDFLQIYETKKKKKGKIAKYFYKKIEDTKNKYNNKKNSTKSEDVNSVVRNKETDVKRYSDVEFSSLKNYSLYENYDLVKEDVDKNTLFPYLFKLLSIAKPLSIQIHPNEVQTLYLNTLNPVLYKDKVFKTEMCVCIKDMSLLCGFMNIFKIAFLVTSVGELHDFFLKREKPAGGGSADSGSVNCMGEAVQGVAPTGEQPKDIFHLFDLFHTQKDEHVEELMKMLARIYIYIISYSLKRGSRQTYDVLSVIDNYAECIQKYVFDEGFFLGFYKNEKFLEQNLNLGNLIKLEKEKLQNSGGGRRGAAGLSGSDDEEEEELEVDVKGGADAGSKVEIEVGSKAELAGEDTALDAVSASAAAAGGDPEETRCVENAPRQVKKQNRGVEEEEVGVKEEGASPGAPHAAPPDAAPHPDKKQDLQCAAQLVSRKKIKSFYEHMFKYLVYRTMLVEGEVLSKCVNDIATKNEKYKSFLKEKELTNKSPEEIYSDVCKKKNYQDVQSDTESFIIGNIFEILHNVSKFYPNDGGRIFVFILQQLNLKDGDVVYIKPGVIHSYISGHCLECMTNSDLVIRGGLTNKEMDKLNFIKYVNYKSNFPIILEKEFINYNIISYSYYKMKYFKILFLTVRPGESVTFLFSDVSFTSCIVLSSNRTVKIKGRKNDKKKASIKGVKKGTVFFIAPGILVTLANFYASEADGDKELVLYCATA
ncbi:mannose-6-phosphate isomerase [Plasmodium vivax Brazil I]|uniref:Mannose-6-phosphate isomerase n=1 Tax=Plasmodium vivax (strain Brazil I) TaxID=1033975 RepID=A0A0J9T3G6_PLAV1|nr:mannose-6-phosphate isomerase [Plasmodium vivax Brazil I]